MKLNHEHFMQGLTIQHLRFVVQPTESKIKRGSSPQTNRFTIDMRISPIIDLWTLSPEFEVAICIPGLLKKYSVMLPCVIGAVNRRASVY